MADREIPRAEWSSFFDCFSKDHEEWITTVELIGDNVGDQIAAANEPLVGISFDPKGSDRGAIEVMLGEDGDDNLTHVIRSPTRVWVRQTGIADQEAIEIESSDGPKTLIRFGAGSASALSAGEQ